MLAIRVLEEHLCWWSPLQIELRIVIPTCAQFLMHATDTQMAVLEQPESWIELSTWSSVSVHHQQRPTKVDYRILHFASYKRGLSFRPKFSFQVGPHIETQNWRRWLVSRVGRWRAQIGVACATSYHDIELTWGRILVVRYCQYGVWTIFTIVHYSKRRYSP